MLGRHIARHIPGNPTVVVQNMPGAGSLRAANYLYNIAPKDGTVFGGFARGIFLDPLLGAPMPCDIRRRNSVGSAASPPTWASAHFARTQASPPGDMQQALQDRRNRRRSGQRRSQLAAQDVQLPMQLVAGYQSAAETVLAIQRKEVDARCGWSWSTLSSRNRDLLVSKQIRVVLQLTDRKLAELAEVPSVLDVAASPDQQAILKLIIARQTMARPYVAPPGIPPERLMALRRAFEATMIDPEFLADAKRQNLDVRPVTGAEADALIKQVYATSPDIVKLAAEFMKGAQ
jgi:tripartite-type tricarboxylate transporter receptor subunit TctC